MNLDEMYDEVFGNKVIRFCRHVVCFTKRLYHYIPAIWKDDDYEFDSCVLYLKVKMEKLKDKLEKDTYYRDSPKRAKQIQIVLNHLDRWINVYNYIDPYLKGVDIKLENGRMTISPEQKRLIKQNIRIEEENRKQFWHYLTKWCGRWSV